MSVATDRAVNLGDSIDSFVAEYCRDLGRTDTTAKGNAFAFWCLIELFGFGAEQAHDLISVGGASDNSMDAFFDDPDGDILVLQVTYNAHTWSHLAKFRTDMERLATAPPTRGKQQVQEAAARLRTAHQRGDAVRYVYVTNQSFSGEDVSKASSLHVGNYPITAWDLDGISQEIADRAAIRPSYATGKELVLRSEQPPLRYEDSIMIPVSLIEFARFVNDGQKWLFSSNVRNYLSRSTVNRQIKETIHTNPSMFWRYNNGVTIVCDEWSEMGDNRLQLRSPQVVNGCQTSNAIRDVVYGFDEQARQELPGALLVRIIREPRDNERVAITRTTNRQNAVKNKDFFALEDFHRTLNAKFKTVGYFYEIQSGSFDQLDPSERSGLTGDARYNHFNWNRRDYRVPAIEAAKCFAAAFHGKVSACYANPGDLAPGGNAYETLFPNDLPEEPELFLIPFLILKHAEAEYGYKSRSADFHSRGRYLFVAAAFLVVTTALKEAGALPEDYERRASPDQLGLLREFFSRQDLTRLALEITEDSMQGFFEDSAVERQVGQDMFAFLKQHVERDAIQGILDQKVTYRLRQAKGAKLRALIETAIQPQRSH